MDANEFHRDEALARLGNNAMIARRAGATGLDVALFIEGSMIGYTPQLKAPSDVAQYALGWCTAAAGQAKSYGATANDIREAACTTLPDTHNAIAWMHRDEVLSEGQCSKVLDVDRLRFREIRDGFENGHLSYLPCTNPKASPCRADNSAS